MITDLTWASAMAVSVLAVCATAFMGYVVEAVHQQLRERREARVELEKEREKTSRQYLESDDESFR